MTVPGSGSTPNGDSEPLTYAGAGVAFLAGSVENVKWYVENLGKGAYTAAGYRGVIDYYIKNGHSPAKAEEKALWGRWEKQAAKVLETA